MNILIMGKPGAGKGTQSDRIIKKYHLTHISTGNIYREEMEKDSEIGKIAKMYINDGNLVPDDITNDIVYNVLAQGNFKHGFMLDGYPRTVSQAEAFDKMLEELHYKLDLVINIDIDDHILLERMAGRRVCKKCGSTYNVTFQPPLVEGVCDNCGGELYQRKDDEETSVLNRLNIYNEKTKPLLSYYEKKGILISIDGSQEANTVTSLIKQAMEAIK